MATTLGYRIKKEKTSNKEDEEGHFFRVPQSAESAAFGSGAALPASLTSARGEYTIYALPNIIFTIIIGARDRLQRGKFFYQELMA